MASKPTIANAIYVPPPGGRRYRRRAGRIVLYVAMSLLALAFALPLLWMVGASLKPEAEVLATPLQFVPADPQWHNYAETFDTLRPFIWNSAYLGVLNVVALLLFASMAGYGFARLDFAGRDLAFALLLATAMVPGIVYLIPEYIIYLNIGWIDTHYPLWVPRVITSITGTFLLRQSFKSLPVELEDAAKLDGASTFEIYWRIMLPQIKPALAAVGVFTFLDSWNDLFGPLIFVSSLELQTLPVALALYQGMFFTQTNLLLAASTLTILPVIVLFIVSQKYFIQGIALSGLKG